MLWTLLVSSCWHFLFKKILQVFCVFCLLYIHLFQLKLLLRRMMHDPCFIACSELKKNQIQGVCWTTKNKLTLRVYLFLRQSFKTGWKKKKKALTCFITEITNILAHVKTQLNQAVKPYSFNDVKRRGF